MNISASYSVTSNESVYKPEKVSPANSEAFSLPEPTPIPVHLHSEPPSDSPNDYYTSTAYQQIDEQREEEEEKNFLQQYIEEEEEVEEKNKEPMIDYLIAALKGEEKEVRMEGNKHMDKVKYMMENFPQLMAAGEIN